MEDIIEIKVTFPIDHTEMSISLPSYVSVSDIKEILELHALSKPPRNNQVLLLDGDVLEDNYLLHNIRRGV